MCELGQLRLLRRLSMKFLRLKTTSILKVGWPTSFLRKPSGLNQSSMRNSVCLRGLHLRKLLLLWTNLTPHHVRRNPQLVDPAFQLHRQSQALERAHLTGDSFKIRAQPNALFMTNRRNVVRFHAHDLTKPTRTTNVLLNKL